MRKSIRRCCERAARNRRENPACAEARERASALFAAIGERLGSERDLLFRYEEALHDLQGLDIPQFYRQGFADGLRRRARPYALRRLGRNT